MRKVFITLGVFIGIIILIVIGAVCYFRIPVHDYYKNSEKAFVIPGLNDGFIAQGLSYDEASDCFFITGYMNQKEASPVYVVNRTTGETVLKVQLADESSVPFVGHCGGLSVHGDYVYIAGGDDQCVYIYDRDEILNAQNDAYVTCLGAFSTKLTEDDAIGVAFTTVYDGQLIVGEFYRDPNYPTPDSHKMTTAGGDYQQALAAAYDFSDAPDAVFGLNSRPTAVYSLPDLAQGMCIRNGKMYISTSYAIAFSHIYVYDMDALSVGEFAEEFPLYYCDSQALVEDMKLPPMSEEIQIVDGKIYTMCESASNKYIFGKLTGAKWCFATELE